MLMSASAANDKNWELVSTVLTCSPHKGDESGVNTEKVLRESWESFELDDSQIICIVTDTAPNMTAAGRLYHCYISYCTNHVLELTTGFAFDDKNISDADNIMKSCRALVGHFSSSPCSLIRCTVRSCTVLRTTLLNPPVHCICIRRYKISCFMFHVRGRPSLAPFTSLQV